MEIEQHQPIPIERGWPMLGVIPNLFSGDPFDYLKNIMLKKGDFVQLNFGTQPVYLASHPDYLQRILRDNYQNYRKPDMLYNTAREVAGNGLITSSGELWLRQRRMIQPHLHRKQLSYLFADIAEAVTDVISDWKSFAQNGDEVELSEKMGEISMNIITRTMFGKGLVPAAEIRQIGLRITRIIKYTGSRLYSAMLPQWFPAFGKQNFLEDKKKMQETVHQIIAKCRQDKEISAGLIKMLIDSVDEESHEQMTEQQLFDEVMTIFIAGYETTATALTWLGVVIHEHPDVLRKIRSEIDNVLGQRNPTFDDIPNLVYIKKVFMEILRMYTLGPILPRALNEPDQLGKYYLPANAMILVSYYGVHHNPSVWDNPEVFDPERFSPEHIANQHPFAYVPFSAGPRKCAGDEFALLEGPLTIATILQKYDINILPNQNFTPGLSATMHPRKGVKATFSFRTSK